MLAPRRSFLCPSFSAFLNKTTPFVRNRRGNLEKSRPEMQNFGMEPRTSSATNTVTAEKAFSFLSKGWREVRDSADADLQLMRKRANTIINLADRELENFLNSTVSVKSPNPSPFLAVPSSSSIAEFEFVKRLSPKISEFRRTYSSPDFSKKVLEKWAPRSKIGIDLSAVRSALVSSEAEANRSILNFDWERRGILWKVQGEEEEGKEWEPIRRLKTGFKEFEKKSQTGEILENLKNSEFVEKVKLSLKSFRGDPTDVKEIPPLDAPELLAYLVRQSAPLLDQLGLKKDICDKIVDTLCSGRKHRLIGKSLSMGDLQKDSVNEELDDRIASVLHSTGHHCDESFWDSKTQEKSDEKRHFAIITTASLPWLTGTAVNPLFRAVYLAKASKQNVTLLVPWLCKSDQELVYPNSLTFSSPEEQESYIRNWLEDRIGFKANFKISFYPGKFSKERRSIIPAGDTSQFISANEADIAILEEPEHLNWYHHGKRWTDKFNHVVGVVHTNYLEYVKRETNGVIKAFFVKHVNNLVARAYCHKVLRLSAATQDLPKSTICNVHGVNPKFLKVGEEVAAERELGQNSFSKGAYFLGKMVWAKGYRELLDLLSKHKSELDSFKLDVYGSGEDAQEVQSVAKRLDLNLNFLKGRDHADASLHGYKVFINPSISDVLCTATAEALAMGKFVVCADHPSNDFFRAFPNCLTYKTSEDFVARVKEAMTSDPQPLTPEQRYNLSWEAATERFMEYSELDKVLNDKNGNATKGKMKKSISLPNLSDAVDGGLAFAHYCLTGNEIFRLSTGAIPGSRDYNMEHCKDLHLLPPYIQNPVYGW